MTNLRHRLLRDESERAPPRSSPPPRRAAPSPRGFKRLFLVLLLFTAAIMYFMGVLTSGTQVMDGVARSLGYSSETHYAVIIDAGSSGSRVLAYRFRVPFSIFSQGGLYLEEEFFKQSKPGLSSFADEPSVGAQTIVQLIRDAEHLIPAHRRRNTPLLVRATAGLRLLPAEKANSLIQHVKDAIHELGYSVSSKAVEIMDGSDEGIFIWYTVNLLHDTMGVYDSMAALDLGGGSTQITYRLGRRESEAVPSEDRFLVPYAGHNISVYTHSYLNLGLLAARYGILRLESPGDSANITSVCVDPIIEDEPWTYANKKLLISGASRKDGWSKSKIIERCQSLVKKYVLSTLDWEPQHAPRGAVAAMSYFYDVAADAGIIDVVKGGSVRISQYEDEAKRSCTESNVEQPWACLDLLYITSLLRDAYKMQHDREIALFKKVKNHEVSWALGLAYTTLTDTLYNTRGS